LEVHWSLDFGAWMLELGLSAAPFPAMMGLCLVTPGGPPW
jgi:hypothetical protein